MGAGAAGREVWRTKGSSYADLYTQNVVINMEEQESQQAQAAEAKAPKERPVWLTQSTVQGAYSENDVLKAGQYHFTTLTLTLDRVNVGAFTLSFNRKSLSHSVILFLSGVVAYSLQSNVLCNRECSYRKYCSLNKLNCVWLLYP